MKFTQINHSHIHHKHNRTHIINTYTHITGYPNPNETVDLLLAMQEGGADVLELGIPFTDPQADGATIQKANEVALTYNVTLQGCIDMVELAILPSIFIQ